MTSVHDVAVSLLPQAPTLGEQVGRYIVERIPEIGDAETADLILTSTRATSNALLDGLVRGVSLGSVAPTVEVRQLTRAFAQRGMTLPVVMHAYRIGGQWWIERWTQAVQDHASEGAMAVVQAGHQFILNWLDEMTEQLLKEYHDETERLARERSLAQVEEVRRVLGEPLKDVAAASARLGYDLAGHHVALVMRHGAETAWLPGRPLIVRVDLDTTWCWLRGDPGRLPPPPPPAVAAQGRPGEGLEGFRRSHLEALKALRVAELSGRRPGSITRFDTVDVAALCLGDEGWCRTFVATELGALAADDDTTRRLRATVQAFLDSNSNFRATAARLGVHHNTVRYRLDQAEKQLGRAVGERRLALELALHLASRIGLEQPADY